jgi:cobalt/nickel transport system permease protein
MHVPDHFLNDPTSVVTAVLGIGGVGAALVAARKGALRPTGGVTPATVAATTALVFGLQMLNYPVSSGTRGPLLGGALAAALLGPAWGVVCLSAVLSVQALVFADGGLTALGTNVLLMALVGTLVGWGAALGAAGLRSSWRGRSASGASRTTPAGVVALTAGLGGFVSVVAAAAVFTGLFAIGGTMPVNLGTLAGQMLGVHGLVGIGEAVITAAVVGAVARVAPGWGRLDASLGSVPSELGANVPKRAAVALGAGAVVAAGVLSPFASSAPDGLEATSAAVGFAGAARDHAFAGLPLADYGDAAGWSVQLVGLLGLVVVASASLGLARVLVPRRIARAGVVRA